VYIPTHVLNVVLDRLHWLSFPRPSASLIREPTWTHKTIGANNQWQLEQHALPTVAAAVNGRNSRRVVSYAPPRALTDLSLADMFFAGAPSDEQQQARWTELLGSVPQLERFDIQVQGVVPLLAVLPTHLPHLLFLKLVVVAFTAGSGVIARLAHPTVQELELQFMGCIPVDEAPLQQLLHSPRLPQLASCKCLCL
jgi:hypothetical protein